MIRILAVAAVVLMTTAGSATAAPDKWAFARQMSEISDFLFARPMCEIADYKIHPESFEKTWDAATLDAVQSGLPVAVVTQISDAAFDTREADTKRIAQDFADKVSKAFTDEGADAVMELVEDHFNYIDGKCRGFAESAQFGALITAPKDPANKAGFARFARAVSDQLKAAIDNS